MELHLIPRPVRLFGEQVDFCYDDLDMHCPNCQPSSNKFARQTFLPVTPLYQIYRLAFVIGLIVLLYALFFAGAGLILYLYFTVACLFFIAELIKIVIFFADVERYRCAACRTVIDLKDCPTEECVRGQCRKCHSKDFLTLTPPSRGLRVLAIIYVVALSIVLIILISWLVPIFAWFNSGSLGLFVFLFILSVPILAIGSILFNPVKHSGKHIFGGKRTFVCVKCHTRNRF